MGKHKMSLADAERYDLLKRENKHLKRTIARLEKQLSRVDVERFENLQGAVSAVEKEDKQFHAKNQKEALREKWRCFKCNEGFLKIIILQRGRDIIYFRRCSNCGKKTKTQKYNTEVDQGL